MNFELSEEHQLIRDSARDFALTELWPDVIERDEEQRFPAEAIKKMGELGFLGMMVDLPKEINWLIRIFQGCRERSPFCSPKMENPMSFNPRMSKLWQKMISLPELHLKTFLPARPTTVRFPRVLPNIR